MNMEIAYLEFVKLYKETNRLIHHNYWWGDCIINKKMTLFTAIKESATLIKYFGPIYIDFDDYPSYGGTISENFETNINVHVWCDYG